MLCVVYLLLMVVSGGPKLEIVQQVYFPWSSGSAVVWSCPSLSFLAATHSIFLLCTDVDAHTIVQ